MDASIKFVILAVVLASVAAQQQQQLPPLTGHQTPVSHHQSAQNIPDAVIGGVPLDAADTPVTNHYPYQSTGLTPSSSYHQPYSGSNYGNRDVYNGNRDGSGWSSYPYIGVSAGMDYLFSAYIGPVIWGLVGVMATFGLCVAVSRLVMGTDILGGIFQKSKDADKGARSLDMDNITNMVYGALETYGKYAAKQARDEDMAGVKG